MAESLIDTIPDEINGNNPVVVVGSQTSGYVFRGYRDTDVYRLDLVGGQSYILNAVTPPESVGFNFQVLNPDGSIADVPRYGDEYYIGYNRLWARDIDFLLEFDADTTLFFQIPGRYGTTRPYSFLLSEASTGPGGSGDDFIRWSDTFDILSGGAGTDTLSFADLTSGIELRLYDGTVSGPDFNSPAADLFINDIEVIEGTNRNDVLMGDYFLRGFQFLNKRDVRAPQDEISWFGLDGDDTLGSTRGTTLFDGGPGTDTADYEDASSNVVVSLATGMGTLGDAAGDRLTGIENLIGSQFDDTLEGDAGNNLIVGGRGNDSLTGLGGDDTLDGFGMQWEPEPPADRAVFRFARDEYEVSASADEKGRISAIVNHVGGTQEDGQDTVLNISFLEFSDQTQYIGEALDFAPSAISPDAPELALDEIQNLRFEFPQDIDVFAISLEAGKTYSIRFSEAAVEAYRVSLLDSAGVELPSAYFSGLSLPQREAVSLFDFVFEVEQTGTHYLRFTDTIRTIPSDITSGLRLVEGGEFTVTEVPSATLGTNGDDTILLSSTRFLADGLLGDDRLVVDLSPAEVDGSTLVFAGTYVDDQSDLPKYVIGNRLEADGVTRFSTGLSGFEHYQGSNSPDQFLFNQPLGETHTKRVSFFGRNGNDLFVDTKGPNHFDGGGGIDTVRYESASQADDRYVGGGVYVDLSIGEGRINGAAGDTFESIEAVVGSRFNDTLIAAEDTVLLNGDRGVNLLIPHQSGGINLISYSGRDMVSFVEFDDYDGRPSSTPRITVDLERDTVQSEDLAFREISLRSVNNITGTEFYDLIYGNRADNGLFGAGGWDWIFPYSGSNSIDGGTGRDMVSYANLWIYSSPKGFRIDVDLGAGTVHKLSDEIEIDTLTSIERVTGTAAPDKLRGSDQDDELRGLGDYDWFIATEGNDTLDGGDGLDMVSFQEWQGDATPTTADIFNIRSIDFNGVRVDLSDPSNNHNLAAGQTLIDIERITGSSHQDIFFGDENENLFRGLGGYDFFVGSSGGRERYYGGEGLDTVTYYASQKGVVASLGNGAVIDGAPSGYGTGGDAALDLYFSIEHLIGSNSSDVLTGSFLANQLNGLAGDDVLNGLAGNDYMKGGAGNDTLNGGDGSDFALFTGNRAEYSLARTGFGQVVVSGVDGTDSLIDVEYFQFDDETVNIWDLGLV